MATTGLCALSVLARFGLMAWRNGIDFPYARIEMLPARMVRISIACPPSFIWTPGQHYFVNFITCSPFESHPFTIANTCLDIAGQKREMVILIKQQAGLTDRLSRLACRANDSTIPVLLDGPYGGVEGSMREFDRVLLLAGGSGGSFILPILQDIVWGWKLGNVCRHGKLRTNARTDTISYAMTCKHVHLVWAVSTRDAIEWFRETLDAALEEFPAGFITVSIHVTDPTRPLSPQSESNDEKSIDDHSSKFKRDVVSGRPYLAQIINESCVAEGTVGIASCGPDGLPFDVRNAVAAAQVDILRGKVACEEVFLRSESYAW